MTPDEVGMKRRERPLCRRVIEKHVVCTSPVRRASGWWRGRHEPSLQPAECRQPRGAAGRRQSQHPESTP
jgi:hypothetical protein